MDTTTVPTAATLTPTPDRGRVSRAGAVASEGADRHAMRSSGSRRIPEQRVDHGHALGRRPYLEGDAPAVHREGEGEEGAARLLGADEQRQLVEGHGGIELEADASVDRRPAAVRRGGGSRSSCS